MNPNSPLTVYAMVGPMGSGKTTFALKIAKQTGALFQSLDGTIKGFNQPIEDLNDYESLMPKALDLMYATALAYHWTMSKEEFDSQDPRRHLPDPMPGLKLIKVTD